MKMPHTVDDVERDLRERIEAAREFSPGSPLHRAHLGTCRTILIGFLRNTQISEGDEQRLWRMILNEAA
jgi:hypothetical protein